MRKLQRRILLLAASLLPALARAQDLPREAAQKPLEFEPQLMLTEPEEPVVAAPEEDVAKLDASLQRALRKAKNDERLWKQGILAKVEAERSGMKAVLLAKTLGEARLRSARESLASLGAGTPEALAAAGEVVRQAEAEAQASNAAYLKAQLEAASLNLWRQQKLQAWGGASKAAVARAQAQLTQAQRLQAGEAILTAAPAK